MKSPASTKVTTSEFNPSINSSRVQRSRNWSKLVAALNSTHLFKRVAYPLGVSFSPGFPFLNFLRKVPAVRSKALNRVFFTTLESKDWSRDRRVPTYSAFTVSVRLKLAASSCQLWIQQCFSNRIKMASVDSTFCTIGKGVANCGSSQVPLRIVFLDFRQFYFMGSLPFFFLPLAFHYKQGDSFAPHGFTELPYAFYPFKGYPFPRFNINRSISVSIVSIIFSSEIWHSASVFIFFVNKANENIKCKKKKFYCSEIKFYFSEIKFVSYRRNTKLTLNIFF